MNMLLIGGLIGFLSAIGKDLLLERTKNKKKEIEFKKQKLEEVFVLMSIISKETIKPLELRNSLNNADIKVPMILRFYFPKLYQKYIIFLKEYEKINNIFLSKKIPIAKDGVDFNKAYQSFLQEIVKESHHLNC